MARLMSVTLTEQAVVDRQKTVTRRLGWLTLKPGDRLSLVRKVMGRKAGEPLVRLAEVEVISVRREPLNAITPADVRAEGFGDWVEDFGEYATNRFVGMFCGHMDCDEDVQVTRIEWKYVDPAEGEAGDGTA